MHEKQGGDQEMTERATSNKEIWEHLWESSSLHFSSYASFFFAFLACFLLRITMREGKERERIKGAFRV